MSAPVATENKDLTSQEIYELLAEVEGAVISVTFDSESKAEQFRVRMYQTKKRMEEHMLAIGFMDEIEVKQLSCKIVPEGSNYTVKMTLSPRPEPTKFHVMIQVPTKDS